MALISQTKQRVAKTVRSGLFFVLRTGKSDTPDKQHGAVRDGQKGAWISVAIIHLVG